MKPFLIFLIGITSFGALAQVPYEKEADIQKLLELSRSRVRMLTMERWAAMVGVCAHDASSDLTELVLVTQFETLPLGGLLITAVDRMEEEKKGSITYQRQIDYIEDKSKFGGGGDTRVLANIFGGALGGAISVVGGGFFDGLEWLTGDPHQPMMRYLSSVSFFPAFSGTKIRLEDLAQKSESCKLAHLKYQAAKEASQILKGKNTQVAVNDAEIEFQAQASQSPKKYKGARAD